MRFIKTYLLVSTLLFFCLFAKSQVKNLNATKTNQSVKIDGNLTDDAWINVPYVTDFVTAQPVFGNISAHKTEVKVIYDNEAIYVAAYLYNNPETIRKQFTERDKLDRQDVDIFTIGFDTYQDRLNAFVFRVSSAGVQGDTKISNSSTYDVTWDAVWDSKVSFKKDGWVVELKIPFSAIRFAKTPVQNWGINFSRFERATNELSTWSPINPGVGGELNQWGNWNNVKNITPPVRLFFLPYLSGGIRASPTQKGNVTEYLKSGGNNRGAYLNVASQSNSVGSEILTTTSTNILATPAWTSAGAITLTATTTNPTKNGSKF